jgi:multiple sugar transport system permease protein/raffinose/stachyose/melibiose transport system permease protein
MAARVEPSGRAVGHDARTASYPAAPRRRRTSRRDRFEIALLTGPAVIVFVTFVIVPVLLAAYYGFYKWSGFGRPTDFVGMDNYIRILTDTKFQKALMHNASIVVLSLVIQGPLAILIALLMNRKIKGRSLIRILLFMPWVVAEVIAATGWNLMAATQGAFNAALRNIGLGSWTQDWLANPSIAIFTLMFILTWKYLGFAIILFMAGMQNIPADLYEAASVDGASYWQMQTRITIPLLAPTVRIWAFLSIIGSMQLFDLVYIIWRKVDGVAGVSTMATYMVRYGRDAGQYGMGSAIAVVLFLVSLIVALAYQRLVLRRDTAGAITGGVR